MSVPTLADVLSAAARIRPFVVRTPLERSAALSELVGSDVYLKLECFQNTGSFKLRGALNALLNTDAHHVVTASAGNHGLGVARAARLLGRTATVVVPATASTAKVEALERSGAELRLCGANYDAAEQAGRDLAHERDLPFVSAYNDPHVVAGGGTIALEILEDLPSLNSLLVPAGGGGLISGVGIAVHGVRADVRVYGIQSDASPSLHAALAANAIVPVDVGESLADGLAGNIEAGSITFDIARQHVAQVALVSEDAIARAMRFLLEHEHILVEGSAAVGVAALQDRLVDAGGPAVVLLTGRNVAAAVLQQYVLTN